MLCGIDTTQLGMARVIKQRFGDTLSEDIVEASGGSNTEISYMINTGGTAINVKAWSQKGVTKDLQVEPDSVPTYDIGNAGIPNTSVPINDSRRKQCTIGGKICRARQ
jgi:hypothetical protein